MTYQEVKALLDTVGIPVVYYEWPVGQAPEPPYICYYYPGDNDFKADDSNYQKIRTLTVELYTDKKDFELEEATEAVLSGLVYSRDETNIESERMYLVSYEMEVVING